MSGVFIQVKFFILTLILGVFAGIIFHFYQLTIRRAGIGKILLYILDFFLWLIMIGFVFVSMLLINQGEMRVYVLIALLLGILMYFKVFASHLEVFLSRIAGLLLILLSKLYKIMENCLYLIAGWLRAMRKKRGNDPPDNQGPEEKG